MRIEPKPTYSMKYVEVQYFDHLLLVSAPITVNMPPLIAEETDYIAGTVEKRRHEFTVGRGLARYGMELLGFPPQAIPVGEMRQPLWPDVLVGSITHTDTHCSVVLGRSVHCLSIGIDMETVGRVTRELWKRIFCKDECDYLDSLPATDREQTACLIFSAKEAYYKMQYPLTNILE